MIASAWSTGRPATIARAASVPSASTTSAATSDVGRPVQHLVQLDVGARLPLPPAQVVQRAVAADGGEPPPEAVGVTGEPVEVAERLRPRLAGHVLGVVGTDQHGQVAQQGRVDLPVDRPQGVLVAGEHPLHAASRGSGTGTVVGSTP